MLTEWIRCSVRVQQKGERRNVWLGGDGPVRFQIAGLVQEQHRSEAQGVEVGRVQGEAGV